MKKWLIVLTALAALSLLAAPLALAAGHGNPHAGKGKAKFQCQAKFVSFDVATGALVVTVKSGSKTLRAYGEQITVQVDPKAKLINASVDPAVPLTLDQLVPDATVHLGGTIVLSQSAVDTPVFTATKVILQKLPAATPTSSSSPTS
jgi:hypothetical protein